MVQKTIGKKRPNLFRMTTKRKVTLSDFNGHLRSHAEQKDYSISDLLEFSSELKPEKVTKRLEKLGEEATRFKEAHDVILVVKSHHQPHRLHFWFMEKRNWENEWDIPLDVFERGINTATNFLEYNKTLSPRHISYYDKVAKVLEEMLIFRQNGEAELRESR